MPFSLLCSQCPLLTLCPQSCLFPLQACACSFSTSKLLEHGWACCLEQRKGAAADKGSQVCCVCTSLPDHQ